MTADHVTTPSDKVLLAVAIAERVQSAGREELLRLYDDIEQQRKGRIHGEEWDAKVLVRAEILRRMEP